MLILFNANLTIISSAWVHQAAREIPIAVNNESWQRERLKQQYCQENTITNTK
jgi:hypothetical protein